jgi:hypothetical protein
VIRGQHEPLVCPGQYLACVSEQILADAVRSPARPAGLDQPSERAEAARQPGAVGGGR